MKCINHNYLVSQVNPSDRRICCKCGAVEPSRSELIAGELRRVLTHGCSCHGCSLNKGRQGIGIAGPCKCIEAIYELSLELAAEIEPLLRRRGMAWVPHNPFPVLHLKHQEKEAMKP